MEIETKRKKKRRNGETYLLESINAPHRCYQFLLCPWETLLIDNTSLSLQSLETDSPSFPVTISRSIRVGSSDGNYLPFLA